MAHGSDDAVFPEEPECVLMLGFATATTNTSRFATGQGSLWDWGNPHAVADRAWNGVHAAATAIPEMIRLAYDRPIAKRYYTGISTGGRYGLLEAQGGWTYLFVGSRVLFEIALGLVRFPSRDAPLGLTAPLADWRAEEWRHAFLEVLEACSPVDPDIDGFCVRGDKLLIAQVWGDARIDPHHALWYWDDLFVDWRTVEAFESSEPPEGNGHVGTQALSRA